MDSIVQLPLDFNSHELCECGCGSVVTVGRRFISGHNAYLFDPIAAFWSKVDKSGGPDACWPWISRAHMNGGYGAARWKGQTRNAHSVAYEIANGPVPKGHVVCHSCDNRPCCNPTHLFLGTQAENIQDAVRKGRTARGEAHHWDKLTAEQVRAIRAAYNPSKRNGAEVARQFGINRHTVYDIAAGRSWRHLP